MSKVSDEAFYAAVLTKTGHLEQARKPGAMRPGLLGGETARPAPSMEVSLARHGRYVEQDRKAGVRRAALAPRARPLHSRYTERGREAGARRAALAPPLGAQARPRVLERPGRPLCRARLAAGVSKKGRWS